MAIKRKAPKTFKRKKVAPLQPEVVVETVKTLVEISDVETAVPQPANETEAAKEETKENDEKITLDELEEKDVEEAKEEEKAEPEPAEKKEMAEEAQKPKEEPEEKAPETDTDTLDLDDKNEKRSSKKFVIGIGIIAGLLIATGVLLYLMFQTSFQKSKEEVKVEKVTPTPQKKLVRENWTFEVLNGSGIAGLASKKAKLLEEAGFKVGKTGNADNQNYETTELYVSADMYDQSKLLIEDLRTNFNITEVKGKLQDSTASARIILGKDQQ